ncbi:hypothetical protein QCA50_009712 [Cerrena zonata]|uniref:SWIM-type domain-containing protein n=1 Tax=Cerrena zonata TaxID=2478898 RepID=A0AAW0GBC3_9APHY
MSGEPSTSRTRLLVLAAISVYIEARQTNAAAPNHPTTPLQRAASLGVPVVLLEVPPLLQRGVSAGGMILFTDLESVFLQTSEASSFATLPGSVLSHHGKDDLLPLSDEQEAYWYTLNSVASIFRIDAYLYVLQDWDIKEECLQIGVYYHITRSPQGANVYGISCTCPSFKWDRSTPCIHAVILKSKIHEINHNYPILAPVPTPPVVLLQTTPFRDRYIFSCISSMGRYESGKQSIVSLQCDGRWHCASDGYVITCKHRLHTELFAKTAGLVSEGDQVPVRSSEADSDENVLITKTNGMRIHDPISHQRIPPPRWCSLPDEASGMICTDNSNFDIGPAARCCCGLMLKDVGGPVEGHTSEKSATLYGLKASRIITIPIIQCPVCKHSRRAIGPDLSEYGLFNWNNTMVFSHELLTAYLNMYTASETPFSAFCLTVRRWYEDNSAINSHLTFCSDETFVRVWFAFIQLLDIDSKMVCPQCGPNPDIIIVDGVSLSTHVSKLTRHIHPPTFVDDTCENIDSITTYKARQLPAIPEKEI